MKECPGIFSAIVLVALAVSCAQNSDKGAVVSASGGPELRWQYETGG
jgi:hypothetical protein